MARKGKVTLIEDRCKGCSFCVEYCPTNVLEMSEEYSDKGYHYPIIKFPEKCIACNLCGEYCPDFAIWGEEIKDES